jgi:hypothetical protein
MPAPPRLQRDAQHGSEDGDHLTITIVGPGESASHPLQRGPAAPSP